MIRAQAQDDSTLVLAIDTCSASPGVALAGGSAVLASRHLGRGRSRAEAVADLVGAVLDEVGAGVGDLTGIGVVRGPGSYTGVRVGLALVRGLALVDSVPVVAAGSLELAALSVEAQGADLFVVLDAGRGRLYAAGYHQRAADVVESVAPCLLACDELRARLVGEQTRWIVCSEEGAHIALEAAQPRAEFAAERAGTLVRWAVGRLVAGQRDAADSVLPLYVGAPSFRYNPTKVLRASGPARQA